MENTIIKNSVILDLDVYTSIQKELEDLRKSKLCSIVIHNDQYSWRSEGIIYSHPYVSVDSGEEFKKIVEQIVNNYYSKYDDIIKSNNEKDAKIDKLKSIINKDTYIQEKIKEISDLKYKLHKYEDQENYIEKLKKENELLKIKKK